MIPLSHASPPADLFAIAADLGLIPAEQVETLREDCARSGLPPPQFLTSRGLAGAVELDILETLAATSDVITGYRVLGLIGKGGMGVVYRAEQRALGRVVALKTILVSRMTDPGMLDRFELEARTIGQLRHPNIITAYDFGRQGGRLHLAMELVEGTDLDQQLKSRGQLDEWLVWGLARQTAAGLAHAAQHRVVHRDIKPANLMLVDPPEGYPLPPGLPMVKIADFGLALLQADLDERTRLTATNATLGSPHYMAPEQMESSDVDFRADMYSLGATIFHALAGRPPFAGMKLSQLINAKLGDGPQPIGECRPELEPATCALVGRLLQRQPADRPASYADLLHEIDDVVHSLQTTTLPVPAKREAPPLRSGELPGEATDPQHALQTLASGLPTAARPRRSRMIAAGIGLLAAGLLLAAVWIWRPEQPPSTIVLPQRVPSSSSGPALSLLNGIDTRGWVIGHGNWVYVVGEAVLSGADGLISRPIPPDPAGGEGDAPPEPLRWYRLELILPPLVAAAAPGAGPLAQEVHFGLAAGGREDDGPHYLLRRTVEKLQFGSRRSNAAELVADPHAAPRDADSQATLAVTIERLPTGWFVVVNNVDLGAVPLRPQERPLIRLRAEGRARFAELVVHPLAPQLKQE